MIVIFRGYKGEVAIHREGKIFYTLDPAAEGNLWRNCYTDLLKIGIPIGAYCWWISSADDVTYYDGRRRMI